MASTDNEDQRKPAALTQEELIAQAAEQSSDEESAIGRRPPTTDEHANLIPSQKPLVHIPVTMMPHPAPTLPHGFIAALCQQYQQTDTGKAVQDMAMDMLQFAHQVTQAQTLDAIIPSLLQNYGTEPPDPGFLLCQSHGKLILLYGLTKCSQMQTHGATK